MAENVTDEDLRKAMEEVIRIEEFCSNVRNILSNSTNQPTNVNRQSTEYQRQSSIRTELRRLFPSVNSSSKRHKKSTKPISSNDKQKDYSYNITFQRYVFLLNK